MGRKLVYQGQYLDSKLILLLSMLLFDLETLNIIDH